jgi:hypothetical protein
MISINKSRFWIYAKWDMTINKSFYRSIAIVTMSLVFMVTILGFFIRLTEWNSIKASMRHLNVADGDYDMSEIGNALSVNGTAYVALIICLIAIIIFAGCINHPLRNKQGRITTLTLPASNGERYLWHVLLMLGGGTLLCLVSYALADLLNAGLSVVTFGADGTHSLIGAIANAIERFTTKVVIPVFANNEKSEEGVLFLLMLFSAVLSYPFQVTLFAFGNALKYKFNILFTVIAIQVIEFVLSILFFIVGLSGAFAWFDNISSEDFLVLLFIVFSVLIIAQLVLMVLMWRKSYKLYCRAQVTNAWNK